MSFEPKEKSYQESFEPMPMANEPPPAPEPKTYSGDSDGLREASRDLNDTREQAPIIERGYVSNAGEDRGKPRPANETRTLKQSAADLANMRREEQELTDLMASQEFASEVDADRIAAMAEQQAQVQPDLTPQPEVQQASSPAPNGVSPKIQAALADPEIRDAINAQIQQSEVARQAYSAAAEQFAQASMANLLTGFPELAGVPAAQLGVAIKTVAQTNPQRAEQMARHIQTTAQHIQMAQQQQQQQRQAEQQENAARFNGWAAQQDAAFDQYTVDRPAAEVKAVREAVTDTLVKEYGINKDELAQLWHSSPLLRSAPVQRLLYDVTRFHLARQGMQKIPAKLPRVIRPGMDGDFAPTYDATGLTEATKQFENEPNARNAARRLLALRAHRAANQR